MRVRNRGEVLRYDVSDMMSGPLSCFQSGLSGGVVYCTHRPFETIVCDCAVQAVGGRVLSVLSTTRGTSSKLGYAKTHKHTCTKKRQLRHE